MNSSKSQRNHNGMPMNNRKRRRGRRNKTNHNINNNHTHNNINNHNHNNNNNNDHIINHQNNNNNNTNNMIHNNSTINNKPKIINRSTPSKLSYAERMKNNSSLKSKQIRTPSLKIHNNTNNGLSSPYNNGGFNVSSSPISLHGNISKDELLKIRMQQRDICYVAGLPKSICSRQTLGSKKWFGQFGKIRDITITDNQNCIRTNWMCVHIKYFDNASAAKAVKTMNHKKLDDGRVLEANYGTQRYCEFFINNKKCHKSNCPFRHSWCQLNEIVNFNQHHQIIPYKPPQTQHQPPSPQQQQQQQPPQPQQPQHPQIITHSQQSPSVISTPKQIRPSPPPQHNNNGNNNQQPQHNQIQHPQHNLHHQPSIHSVPSTHSSTDLLKENNVIHSDENMATNSNHNMNLMSYNDDSYIGSQTKSLNGDDIMILSNDNNSNYEHEHNLHHVDHADMHDINNYVDSQQMEMNEMYQEIQHFKQENESQKEKIAEYEKELEIKEGEINKLRKISGAFAARHEQMMSENERLVTTNSDLESKYNALLIKMGELEQQISTLQNKSLYYKERELNFLDYTLWQSSDVYQWIMTIHGGRFKKYSQTLQQNIMLENVDGGCLKCVNTTDVHRWGITDFRDKQILLESIKHLKSNLGLDQIFNENSNNSMMDVINGIVGDPQSHQPHHQQRSPQNNHQHLHSPTQPQQHHNHNHNHMNNVNFNQ